MKKLSKFWGLASLLLAVTMAFAFKATVAPPCQSGYVFVVFDDNLGNPSGADAFDPSKYVVWTDELDPCDHTNNVVCGFCVPLTEQYFEDPSVANPKLIAIPSDIQTAITNAQSPIPTYSTLVEWRTTP